MQSFAIPGPIILSFVAGTLFGWFNGVLIVCFCATAGSAICYGLSHTIAKSLVLKKFPQLLVKFHKKITENRNNLFWYMLFLRFTPMVPNVFVNMSAPIFGMPIQYFVVGTFLGLIPANVIHIKTGMEAATFDPTKDAMRMFGLLILLSGCALVPTFFTKKLAVDDKDEETTRGFPTPGNKPKTE